MTLSDFAMPAEEAYQFTDPSGRICTHPGRPEETDEQVQARVADLIAKGYVIDTSDNSPLPPHPRPEHRDRGY
ncbi:MAG: hypothetical protein O7F08_05730 [Deltaproteobacteria bacterium]|nr:hypothetical protein [Deltaproteobacteria bacterium]